MKVKVIKEFIDREADMKRRAVGETFEADEQRAKYLETLRFVEKAEKKPRKKADSSDEETAKETN